MPSGRNASVFSPKGFYSWTSLYFTRGGLGLPYAERIHRSAPSDPKRSGQVCISYGAVTSAKDTGIDDVHV